VLLEAVPCSLICFEICGCGYATVWLCDEGSEEGSTRQVELVARLLLETSFLLRVIKT